jgi:hypothetical protein
MFDGQLLDCGGWRARMGECAAEADGFVFWGSSPIAGCLVGTEGTVLIFAARAALVLGVQIRDLHPELLLQISQALFVGFCYRIRDRTDGIFSIVVWLPIDGAEYTVFGDGLKGL